MGFGSKLQVNAKSDPYVVTRKTMITNLWSLDGRLVIFLQLVWFLLFVVYVQAYMNSLNEGFYVLLVFNASKLFNPKNYPSDEVCITILEQWLEKLNIKFRLMTIESNASRAKLVKFVETLRHECVKRLLYEAWQFCGGIKTSGIPIDHIS